ncbi:MAG: glutamate--tRNA ligase [Acidimicrobiia bacterium]|nr:glutamate--tRNA ligase [Acidimicrobiia bacterium]
MRVRFAPSPTGYLHIGNIRTGLYNWLAVRNAGGEMILRSDDTDQARGSHEFYDDIIEGLRWMGLDWDEGIEVGGPHGPYRQSLRLDRYREVSEALVAAGDAYPCFCTAEELDERRKAATAAGKPPGYDGRCRTLDTAEVAARIADGEKHSIRLAIPRPGETVFEDIVRGEVRFGHDHVDDFVIARSNGFPTYHLASSVDDVDFEITHVVRGEDILSSTPKHILLGRAVAALEGKDFDIEYAHLSLLLGPDGKKLSKRHGDTSLKHYRESGYLPEALVNYLALLGWSPGEDETVVSLDEMVRRFDLADVQKNPAIFDVDKLQWLNGVYIRELSAADFVGMTAPLVEADLGRDLSRDERDMFAAVAPLVQERAKLLTEVADQVRFLFVHDLSYDEGSWSKVMTKPEARVAVDAAASRLAELGEWTTVAIEETLRAMLDEHGLNARKGLQPLRVAVSGSSVSPPLFESMEALGQPRTLARLRDVFARL